MSSTIYFQLGNRDRVALRAFIDTLKDFLGILLNLDATLSREPHGTVVWEVVFLKKESPPIIGVMGTPRREFVDVSMSVTGQLLENTRLLNLTADRTSFFSDSALLQLERIAKKTKKLGNVTVYTDREESRQKSVISESTLENVKKLTGVKYTSYGSVAGSLDAITVHNANEFRVWDENSRKPVRCRFNPNMEDQIKQLLRSPVIVSGMIHSNSSGNPVYVDVEEMHSQGSEQLPTIREMSGIVDDFTEGKSLKQYLEDLDE